MYRLKNRRMQRQKQSEINLTPLIDTALTLLIIFMVASPMMHNAINVQLPHAGSSPTAQAQELVLYIDEHQKLFFNGIPVTEETVIPTIQQAIQGKTGQTVFVHGDQSVAYGQVINLVKKVREVENVAQVALATRRS